MEIKELSPSRVNTYLICGRRYYYNYVAKELRIVSSPMAFGLSFHRATEENYFQKVTTKKDLKLNLLTDLFADELALVDGMEWKGNELSRAKDEGVISLGAYQEQIAPWVQPRIVEHEITANVPGRPWKISGRLDVITEANKDHELKTTRKKLSAPWNSARLQAATYTALLRKETGDPKANSRLDYSVCGKNQIVSFEMDFAPDIQRHVLAIFDQVAQGIQREVWVANRGGSFLCSRKYCDFWAACERDCGDRVKD